MPAVSQNWLHIAAERMDRSLRTAQEVLKDTDSPKEALDSAHRLVAKCDLLLTVAVHRYLRGVAQG
jgi:hypothetical protein